MKTPEQFLTDVERRLAHTWPSVAAAEALGLDDPSWPKAFPLGKVTATEAEQGFAAVAAQVQAWRDWAATRRLLGTPQQVPTHATIAAADHAAHLCGGDWVNRLAHARARTKLLAERYPHLSASDTSRDITDSEAPHPSSSPLMSVLRDVEALTDADFDLLRRAADWFTGNDGTGLTPRQVPIEGIHAKWLNSRRHLVRALAGKDDLGLLPDHPARIHFTYLDPGYRSSGGRAHDSATVGDSTRPAYQPQLVVISENKDTALYFPELASAISVEGVGRGGRTIAAFPWLVHAAHVLYWGDMDADGLEILNEFRTAGVRATSILMDRPSYDTWRQFGTDTDAQGRPLGPRTPRPVDALTPAERDLYLTLCSQACPGPRRIEQERIPFTVAVAAISKALR